MAAFLDYYALSFNPFDKQCIKEKDGFMSSDFKQMTSRLEYLKNVRGIGVFTSRPGMGKTFADPRGEPPGRQARPLQGHPGADRISLPGEAAAPHPCSG